MAMTMVVMKKKLTLFTKCEYKHIYIYITSGRLFKNYFMF